MDVQVPRHPPVRLTVRSISIDHMVNLAHTAAMLVVFAWRNLWRNARRTIITLSALTMGVVSIIGVRSYREATFKQMTATITRELVGNFQVHAKGYQRSPDVGSVVKDPRAIEAVIAGAVPGARAERRVLGAALSGAGDVSSGVLISGLVPGARALDIRRGRALGPTAAREVVVGLDLAEQLGVDVGGELALVGQAMDGSVANGRYRVVGVADAGTFELNATAVFLHIEDAQSFFGLGEGVHELVVRLPEGHDDDLPHALSAVRAALDLATLEALSWNEIMPELSGTMESKRKSQGALDFIIFFIVALGVLNAMTMATFERTRELGVMLALGTRPRRIVALIVAESLLQGALAIVAGTAVTAAAFWAIGDLHMGEAFSGDFVGMRLPSVIHLTIQGASVKAATFTAFSTVFVGGLWPALRAARLSPVEAMGST